MKARSLAVLLILLIARHSGAQCQLANPSFELPTARDAPPDGWNVVGNVARTDRLVPHARTAAAITGPRSGGFDISALWQRFDSAPGDVWNCSLVVANDAADPLTGDTTAVVNVEWRDDAGNLIDFESHTIADSSTPTGVMHDVAFTTNPAPPRTSAIRLLVGVLQNTATGTAVVDLVDIDLAGPAGRDAKQWNDFPTDRTIDFAGRLWRIKGPGTYAPGPAHYSDDPDDIRVDDDGLHMTIRRTQDSWHSTEIATADPLAYGDYIFTIRGRPDTWAPNVVLGLFTWTYPRCYEYANPWNLHNEFDIEISRWGDPANDIAQFVTQPYDFMDGANIKRFSVPFNADDPDPLTTFAFRWRPAGVEARAWTGGPDDEFKRPPFATWTYTGPHIPRPGETRVHINFWQLDGPPADGNEHEAVIADFRFIADDATGACCNASGCSVVSRNQCLAGGGFYRGDGTVCDPNPCPTIELRLVNANGVAAEGAIAIADPAQGLELYLQARILRDENATGLTTFDGRFLDDESGTFAPALLTNREATGIDVPGDDIKGRTGMLPAYRSTIGNNNADPGNGYFVNGVFSILPLNIESSGNRQGIAGAWTTVYKVNWSSTDPTPRDVTLTADATFGGYQATSGLQQPINVPPATLQVVVKGAPPCPCETNASTPVDTLDLLAFLDTWFRLEPGADFDDDNAITTTDLLAFLDCWFDATDGHPCP